MVFEGERTDMLVSGWREHSPRKPRTFFIKRTDFFEQRALYRRRRPARCSHSTSRPTPTSTSRTTGSFSTCAAIGQPGERTYPAGALLVIDIDAALAGSRDFAVLFEPTPTCFLAGFQAAGNVVAFKVLDNVRSRVLFCALQRRRAGAPSRCPAFPSLRRSTSIACPRMTSIGPTRGGARDLRHLVPEQHAAAVAVAGADRASDRIAQDRAGAV